MMMLFLIDGENLREFNGKRNSQKNMVFPPPPSPSTPLLFDMRWIFCQSKHFLLKMSHAKKTRTKCASRKYFEEPFKCTFSFAYKLDVYIPITNRQIILEKFF